MAGMRCVLSSESWNLPGRRAAAFVSRSLRLRASSGHTHIPSDVDHGLSPAAVTRISRLRIEAVSMSTTDELLRRRLMALTSVLSRYPQASSEVHALGGLDILLNARKKRNGSDPEDEVEPWARQACSLLGHADPVKGSGVRILSLDGGGVRGVMSICLLERLLEISGNRPVGELFDVVAGTSIGTLISALLIFGKNQPGPMTPQFLELFNSIVRLPFQGSVANLVKYRAKFGHEMINLLGSHFQDKTLSSTARDASTPKVIFTSSLLGTGRTPHPALFLFRNYRPLPNSEPRYMGGCNYSLTHACAASAAAPGYFPGITLHGMPLKDGGLLGNNPLSVALHESRMLWGRETPIQCIVSLGTGLVPLARPSVHEEFSDQSCVSSDLFSGSGVVDVVQNVINSACNNQMMEHIMEDMLLKENYYRFNPPLPYDYPPFTDDVSEIMKLGEDFVKLSEDRLQEAVSKLIIR